MYKLKNVNSRVNALLRTGKDFVKNNLSVSAAQHIIDTGKLVESDNPDYPICIDNQYLEDYLRMGHKKLWWYIEQNDYNLYYAENEVSGRYRDFEKEVL